MQHASVNKLPKGHVDLFVVFITLCLLVIGITMVYSASSMIAYERYKDSFAFLKMQLIACFIGIVGMVVTAHISYRYFQRFAIPLLGFAALLLLLVYSPLGSGVGGFKRWIRIGGFQFQPVEFAKLMLIIYVARFLSNNGEKIRRMRYILLSVVVLSIFFFLIYFQPDFGTAVLISIVVFLMLFVGGARISQIVIFGLIACFFLYSAVVHNPYRLQRLEGFFNSTSDISGKNYQLWQSQNTLATGGIAGVGIGNSIYKLFYLPFPHTDFIFAVLGEELGFIGAIGIIALFMALVWRGGYISLYVSNTFGSMTAMGISTLLGLQAIVNLAVVVGLAPVTGLTLPFISYGGTSLMMSLISIGILLNISREVEEG